MEISRTQTNERLNVQFLKGVLCESVAGVGFRPGKLMNPKGHGLEFRFPNSDNSDDEYGDF